tara:strand:+ start:1215 stop:1841 length:627 start_codon:yes stop_codon:yes gene_type:complete
MDNLIEPIYAVLSLILFSIILRVVLELAHQRWAITFSHTVTIVFLPVITFFVTKVISGDIALSLGMVGALSIVRFRNPVRSPLELTVYFACITSGIAASVHLRWLLYFLVAVLSVVLVLFIISQIYKIFNKNFFISSFSEGNPLSILEISTKSDIDLLDNSKFLNSKIKTQDKISYELSNSNFDDLKTLLEQIRKENDLIDYQLRSNQ